ncbi:serine/threonine protein kinase [Ktedonobacter racemifer]|uniref:non-specific serine/threonine protein kinase n=1 Tax=Ktedonobacter racemifer DSM 44963 TaxID=485913 RepID=D6TRU0_KTERA|nr:serine/threonine-protein kinase [Ktedonobacter racemifer]EFH87870.1 serine/threonine protein kinase [Ktedonobacter racemifer DSM 44963]
MKENESAFLGKTVGNCTIEKVIGRGGMSTVYLAQQQRPARLVAIKILRSEAEGEETADFLARFQREADIIARLEHVHIIPIYAYGEGEGYAYLVMPYVSGGSLSGLLGRQGKLEMHQALGFMMQAASALDYAHQQHVIHRDLKPSNFLLYPDGRLLLADFGIARLVDDRAEDEHNATLTSQGTILGTPAYMAPELLRGEEIDARVDIYALGVIFYQMLSGSVPFKGDNHYAVVDKHLYEPFPALYGVNPEVPLAVDAVLARATAKSREERYETAGAFVKALQDAIYTSEAVTEMKAVVSGVLPTLPASFAGIELVQRSAPYAMPAPAGYLQTPQQPYPPPQSVTAQPPYPTPANQAYWQATPQDGMPVQGSWPQQPIYPQQKQERAWPLVLKALPSLALLAAIIFISLQVMGAFAQKSQGNTGQSGNQQQGNVLVATTTPASQATTVPTAAPTDTPTSTPTPTPIPTQTPVQKAHVVVQSYYDQLNQRDYQGAYNQLSPNFQNSLSYDRFSSGYSKVHHQDITFLSETPNGDGTVTEAVHLVVQEENDQGVVQTHEQNWTGIIIQQSDGSWKIDSAKFS